jgi:radical SAM protein with 4Fe4S-binding SPASM domain
MALKGVNAMFVPARFLLAKADKARDRQEWALAERNYRAALRRKPHLAAIWTQLGHTLNRQGQPDAALAAYRESERIQPDNADTLHQIGRMLNSLEQNEQALEAYERALALDPDMVDAATEVLRIRAWLGSRRNPRFAGLPESLGFVAFGTTGTCNASCIHCPTGKAETAVNPRFPMPMPLFKKIVDGIADLEFTITGQVSFGLFGDGLVDPYVVERAAYLRNRLPGAFLSVNTNGAAFNAKRHAALNDTASVIALHCESLNPEVYNELMQPLRFERVFPKYEKILKTFPRNVHVSVPVSRLNKAELSSIREWFLDHGARFVQFDPLSARCAEDRSVFDSLALGPRKIRCPSRIMDDNLIVDCDGQVLMCCNDFQRIEAIGNLQEESVAETLLGIRRANVRKMLAERRHEEFKTCSRCYADQLLQKLPAC